MTVGIACGLATAGCRDKRNSEASTAGPAPPAAADGPRTELVRSLIDAWWSAELDAGGVFVDFGTSDQHKFTRGGWRTGWGERGRDETHTFASLGARGVVLVPGRGPPPEALAVRVRATCPGVTVRAAVNGRVIGRDVVSPGAWRTLRWATGGAPWNDRNTVKLAATTGDADSSEAAWLRDDDGEPSVGPVRRLTDRLARDGAREPVRDAVSPERACLRVDWLWLPRAGAGSPPSEPRVGARELGGRPHRALSAPADAVVSFYEQLPPRTRLTMHVGASTGATVSITVVTDDRRTEVFRESIGPRTWREAHVDLAAYADRPVRIDLHCTAACAWGEPELRRDSRDTPARDSGPAPRHVVLIIVDTLRADVFSPYRDEPRVVAPVFDALASGGVVFRNAYTNSTWTRPAMASLFTGTSPRRHGVHDYGQALADEAALVSESLQDAGFTTAYFTANPVCSARFGFDQGWDWFWNYFHGQNLDPTRPTPSVGADRVFSDGLTWVRNQRAAGVDRIALVLHTMDPHVPYRVDRAYTRRYHPDPYRGPIGPAFELADYLASWKATGDPRRLAIDAADAAWIRALYDGIVTYHDEQLGAFIDGIDELGLLDDTLVIVTSDHGEELTDRGRVGHGHTVYEELARIPLVLHYPRALPSGLVVDQPVELVDLAPTMLELLGLDPGIDHDGRSLAPAARGGLPDATVAVVENQAARQHAIRLGRYKLVVAPDTGSALYDLSIDPGERSPIDAPVTRRVAEVRLAEALAIPHKRDRGGGVVASPPATTAPARTESQRALESLGYFGKDLSEGP